LATGRTAPSWVAVVAALVAAGEAQAQDPVSGLGAYFTLSSGYWKHGLSQSDGASLQLGLDYQHYSGFFAYARAMNVDYPQNLPGYKRDVEASAYVGYHDRTDRWSWTVSAGRYVYPGADSYDYDEWSGSVGFRDRVFYTASYNPKYYVRDASALNQEVSVAFPLPGNFEVGGAVGYFDVDLDGGPHITHWNVGASKLVGRMALDLRYYDGNYSYRNYLGDPSAENYVVSVSYALKSQRSRSLR
jgi:uncharacterized protein (TIGR02001 family)